MAYLSFEQVAVSNSILSVADLTVPANATLCELQADTNPIRYTMDDTTDPTTSAGMVLLTTSDPKLFLVSDILNIRFIRSGGSDAKLNVHYLAGRDV